MSIALRADIELGDFIRARDLGHVCGIVRRAVTVASGRLPGFEIEMASGRTDFIDEASAELVAFSEPHLRRLLAEQADDVAAQIDALQENMARGGSGEVRES